AAPKIVQRQGELYLMVVSTQHATWLVPGAAILVLVGAVTVWRPWAGDGAQPIKQAAAPAASAPSIATPAATSKSASAPAPTSPTAPSFDVVKVDPTGNAVIAGRAAPGAQVSVMDGDKKLGEVTADNRGEWVLVGKEPLAAGDRQLRLE